MDIAAANFMSCFQDTQDIFIILSGCSLLIVYCFLDYKEQLEQLKEKGYSSSQIARLVKSSCSTVATFFELHDVLSEKLTPKQLIRIATHNGGSKNLETVRENSAKLSQFFTLDAIKKFVKKCSNKSLSLLNILIQNVNEKKLTLNKDGFMHAIKKGAQTFHAYYIKEMKALQPPKKW